MQISVKMSLMDKIHRLREALSSETNPDILLSTKAIIQGMSYYYLAVNTKIAKLRYDKHCRDCKHNVKDPVVSMHEIDKQIPDLTGKMCDHCGGCVLSFKIRQDIKKCEFWDE